MQALDEDGGADVPAAADAGRPARATARAWATWGVGASFYLVAVFHRMALGVAGLRAEHRLHVDHGALASFTALQFLMYLAMQLPAGLAADRIGPRRTLAAGLACIAAGEAVFALAHGLGLGLAGRALVGMGDALTFLNVLRLTHTWFPPRHGALLATLTGVVGGLGQLLGTVPLHWALDRYGWTATFAASSVLTALLFVVALTVIRDRPPGMPAPTHATHAPIAATLRQALARRGTRHGFWIHLAIFCPFQVVGALWGVPFLVQGQGLSTDTAATYLLAMTAAFVLSGPLIGGLASGGGPARRNRLLLALNALLLAPWAAILLWPSHAVPRPLLLAGFVLCGAAAPGGMVAFDVARRANPPHAVGAANGIVNCGGFLGAVVCLELVGLLLGGGTPSASRFQHALLPMLGLSALGLARSARLAGYRPIRSLTAAWAAATRAIGTRNGEQET